jgi:hypothetical protein
LNIFDSTDFDRLHRRSQKRIFQKLDQTMENPISEEKIHGKPDIRGHKIKPSKGKLLPKVFKKLERLVQSAKNGFKKI